MTQVSHSHQDHSCKYLIPMDLMCASCFGYGRCFINGSATLWSVYTLHTFTSPRPMILLMRWQCHSTCVGPFVCPRLLCLCYGSTIITIKIHRTGRTRNNTQLRNKISDPNNFLYSFRSSNILSFCHWIYYSILVGPFSAHHLSIEAKHKTRLWFRIIRINLEASIIVTLYTELLFTSKHKEHFLDSSQVFYDVLYNYPMSATIISLIPARST
jgi:hypothetical protein